jgi:membrane fusion protein (multidrug efflux system)
MNRYLSILPLAVLAGAPLLAHAAPQQVASLTRVRTIRASTAPGGGSVPASVLAVERATLSTRVAATVQTVRVEEGQRVARGQLLVSLSDADLRGAVAAARTGLDAAVANERRIQNLLAQRAATQAELELVTTQRAQAEAGLAATQANLDYAQIRAPFAGTVQARRVDPGDLVGPGQPLLVLEGDALELQASVSEAEAAGLALGTRLRFEADGASGSATVSALTPGGDPLSHRRGLKARIAGTMPGLRSGAFARIEVKGGAEPANRAWVPRSALVERGDLTGVFVASAGKAELRWIAVGEPVGDGVLVRAGLRPDEAVVDAPGALRDGQPVEVQP